MNPLAKALRAHPDKGLRFPWRVLSDLTLRPGALYIVLGAPGAGKSAFALNLALRLGAPSLYYSMDTMLTDQAKRAVSVLTGFPELRVERTPALWARLLERAAPGLRVYPDAGLPASALGELVAAEEELWAQPPTVTVVDNVKNLARDTSYEEYSSIFGELEALAIKHQTTVVALHHVTRASDGRMRLTAGKYAGEDGASLVLGLTQDRANGKLAVYILKNRFGEADPNGGLVRNLSFEPNRNMRIEG